MIITALLVLGYMICFILSYFILKKIVCSKNPHEPLDTEDGIMAVLFSFFGAPVIVVFVTAIVAVYFILKYVAIFLETLALNVTEKLNKDTKAENEIEKCKQILREHGIKVE